MAMNTAFLNLIADAGAAAITHIGLVDDVGAEVGDARKQVTWVAAADGLVRPDADVAFTMEAGDVAAGWRGYTALTGGTGYGGFDFEDGEGAPAPRTFSNPGTLTLLAADTYVDVNAG